MVPVIYDDWRHAPLERKDLIWEGIKQRFTLDEESRSYCMSTVGRLWRSRKTRLRRIIYSCKSDAKIIKKRPKEIDLKEWKFFVKGKSSRVFKIFGIKESVKSYLPIKDSHLRLGFANLLEILKNVLAFGEISKDMESSPVDRAHMRLASAKAVLCLSKDWDHKIPIDDFYLTLRTSEIIDSQNVSPRKDTSALYAMLWKSVDDVSKIHSSVFGPYPCTSSIKKEECKKPSSVIRVDVWAKAHTKENGKPSNEEVAKNLVKIEELKKSLPLNSTPPLLKDDMLSQVLGPERQGRAQSVSKVRSIADDEVLQTQTFTPQAQSKRKAKDTNCKLLSWKGSKVVVAHAQWVIEDPKCMLHNKILGPNVCKVAVTNAVNPLFPLWRATDDATTIGGALKSFIAWPKKYVVMKDD
ncbi:hypothetical protein GIB67_022313 [Kingdonia uniflora]|uniref:DUF8039 domain-containing protein n=1 Tax=Kingdonia uniflora TaxID=39325 RepID=A0A7J7KW34_9MAGN|nr:hypothetical protein GIB67_022313 [Kingdonia uniflora]